MVLVGLADPFHADPPDGGDGPRIGRPHDGDDLLYSLLERPASECLSDLGGITVSPGIGLKLPAHLVFLVRLQRQQGRPADQRPVLATLDCPATGRGEHAGVLADPLLQDEAHRRFVGNAVHHRNQPSRDLGGAVSTQRRRGVVDGPRPQHETIGDEFFGHQLTINGREHTRCGMT